jgi:hypothetical protein
MHFRKGYQNYYNKPPGKMLLILYQRFPNKDNFWHNHQIKFLSIYNQYETILSVHFTLIVILLTLNFFNVNLTK